jgi:dolichol-phosphate mannosyltransferase
MPPPPVRSRKRVSIAVVIPAYRVASHIGHVIRGLPDWIDHIIVVDDQSADGTAEAALAVGDPRLHLERRETNGGVGAATKTGYRVAIRLGADVVVKMDGDNQMDPTQLRSLISPILRGHSDYTKGNRFRHKPGLRVMPFMRRIGNLALSFLAKLASGYWNIFDPTNGYTAIRQEVLLLLPLDEVADRYFFEISMLMNLNLVDASVRDVSMPSRYGDENSSLRIRQVLASFPIKLARAIVWRIWNKYFIYDFTAASLFIVSGVSLVVTGAFNGASYWSRSLATGVPATSGQVMLSVLPLLVGFELLLQAFVIDIAAVPRTSGYGPLLRRHRRTAAPRQALAHGTSDPPRDGADRRGV